MDTLNCIQTRRSVRKYKAKDVPDDLLFEILDAARWAPSSGNVQNTFIIIVKDAAKRKALAKAALNQDWMAQAPVHLVICSNAKMVRDQFGKRGEEIYSVQNTAMAANNIMLASHDFGLATCWVGAFSESAVKKTLQIPANNIDIHAILTLGYAKELPRTPPRQDLAYQTFWEKWSEQKGKKAIGPWPLIKKY